MNRPGGIPIIFWLGGLVAGIGGLLWLRKKNAGDATASPATAGKTGQPAFSQAQEVEDFQVFSALTSAQQGSDLNFLSEVAGLLGGGSSTAGGTSTSTGSGGGSGVPSPPATGNAPPATVPASAVASPAPSAQSQPGYGAGVGSLAAANPGILSANSPGGPNIPGITGYTVSYNGVPL